MELLLAAGSDCNKQNKAGRSPLSLASERGQIAVRCCGGGWIHVPLFSFSFLMARCFSLAMLMRWWSVCGIVRLCVACVGCGCCSITRH
jgi:hypothetical protein